MTYSSPQTVEPWVGSVEITGDSVSLVPTAVEHHDGLVGAVEDGAVWDTWYASVPAPDQMRAEIDRRLDRAARGLMLPFTVLDGAGEIAGMTSYMTIDEPNRRVEIGMTWYRGSAQRTSINTEAKLLLLRHAFDKLGCIAVGFQTSRFNQPSRRAIERLGARLDGVLRNHRVLPDGTVRDTCYYSILDSEWPAVRTHLHWLLGRRASEARGGSGEPTPAR